MSIEYTPGPLLDASRTTPTALWNDSADLDELRQSIAYGGVGATCNPVIGYTTIRKHPDVWEDRIRVIAENNPTWGESHIGWQAIKDMSVEAAQLLEPIFIEHKGRNGRLSIQTDPRLHRDAEALADQAEEFSNLAPNIIVKIPCTSVGIKAIEEATYRGVSVNVTVSFTVAQAVRSAEAIERGLQRRVDEGKPIDGMGPVVTIMARQLPNATASSSTPGTWSGPVSQRSSAPTASSPSADSTPGCCAPRSATSSSGPSWSAATSSSPLRSSGRSASTTPTTRPLPALTSRLLQSVLTPSCRCRSSCVPMTRME